MHVRRRQQSFSPESLAEILRSLPQAPHYWLAYSGGCDSHVLVHAAAQLMKGGGIGSFHAVYIDHGLQSASAEWGRHCAEICAELTLPFSLLQVDARGRSGESPEAAARQARYRAFAEIMGQGDCLLTAHHQDDQAETLLLQLLRGGGPHGLAAMPELSKFAAGMHVRPLLAFSRRQLRDYAQQHTLHWLEDPSNSDADFDRNYLRNEVMPVLRRRWPAVGRIFARGASHQGEAAHLLDNLAAEDLRRCEAENHTLCISALVELDAVRQRNLVRFWLKHLGFKLPDTVRLDQIQHHVIPAAPDRSPEVVWEGVVVRRYRDYLYAMAPRAAIDNQVTFPWNIAQPLLLPDGSNLIASLSYGKGVKRSLCGHQAVTVRYRQGGERCQMTPHRPTRALKNLLQESNVPPWDRKHIPLIYIGEQLAAVADYWVCTPCQADEGEEGVIFEWRRAERG